MQRLPNMTKPSGKSTRHEMEYYDGQRRTVYTVDEGYPQNNGTILISRTDATGIITHANRAFVEVSGYSARELVGAPHYIIRHPDMPKAAYADLWSTVQQGKRWSGYVKNLRADGGYYWVYATVIPKVRGGEIVGHTSVRREPSRDKVSEMEKLYAEMVKAEGR